MSIIVLEYWNVSSQIGKEARQKMQVAKRGDWIVETFPVGTYACNCSLIYSARSGQAIIIDPGNDFLTLGKIIAERNLQVVKLLHTHAHFDHIGQSCHCKAETGAELFLHRDDLFLYQGLVEQGVFFGEEITSPDYPIDHYLEHEMSFDLGTDLKNFLKTLHTPGHTPGSCCFYTDYFDEPILFSGDTLFHQSIGRTDFPGGDAGSILKSIKNSLFTLPDETEVVTGHGQGTRIYAEKRGNPFFQH